MLNEKFLDRNYCEEIRANSNELYFANTNYFMIMEYIVNLLFYGKE